MGDREEYLKKCPAFGWDAEGGSGFDDSTDECRSCTEGDQKMHDACKAEALAGQAAARAQTKETTVTKDDAAKTDKQAKVQAWRDGVAAKVEAPEASQGDANTVATGPGVVAHKQDKGGLEMKGKMKATKKAAEMKEEKTSLGQVVMDTILATKKDGSFTRKQIVGAVKPTTVAKGRTESAISCQVAHAIIFGNRFGLLRTGKGGKVEWI